jgi:hypothetical protein
MGLPALSVVTMVMFCGPSTPLGVIDGDVTAAEGENDAEPSLLQAQEAIPLASVAETVG